MMMMMTRTETQKVVYEATVSCSINRYRYHHHHHCRRQSHKHIILYQQSVTMLLLLLLVGFGMAERSVLIIGGDQDGTIEQFFPSNLTSRVIAKIQFPEKQQSTKFQVTPVNATHAFVLQTYKRSSFFMNQTGHLKPGPVVERRRGPGLTSIPSDHGQMLPTFCGGQKYSGGIDRNCYVVTGQNVRSQNPMLIGHSSFSLTAFGNQLVALDGEDRVEPHSERYDGSQWVKCKNPPRSRFNSVAVKLNETSLLSCGNDERRELHGCFVYHVNNDSWVDLVKMQMNQPPSQGHMVLIGQTIYAFGEKNRTGSKIIQTLDISGGVETAQWKIEDGKNMVKSRTDFGVWVIGSEDTSMKLKAAGFSSTGRFVFIGIVAAIFIALLLACCLARRNQKKRTLNTPTKSDETRLYGDSAETDEQKNFV